MANILNGNDSSAIRTAANMLRAGGVVAFPTETVYGLGADALNERAVAQVFAIKNRPQFDPLIVHVPNRETALQYVVKPIDPRALVLMEKYWPGPLTLVLKKQQSIPDLVTAGLDSVALRVPAHPVALALLRAVGRPIAAPSANPFGYISPTTALHVEEMLGNAIPLIIDGGPCTVGVESTVCAFADGKVVILRPGGVPVEEIEATIGPVEISSPLQADHRSPGTLPSHYAPRTPLALLVAGEVIPQPRQGERVGLLTFMPHQNIKGYAAVEVLSEKGNLIEAAASLFAALRRLDRARLERIIAKPVPEQGLGRAILDRLRRAAN
jgi:L-threonylcarbamoyladenylate synthase